MVEYIKHNEPSLANRMDDVLDALVLAVIGAIGIEQGFTSLPTIPPVDATGLKMQIVGAVIKR